MILSINVVKSTNTSISLPDRGLVGVHAFFDPAMLDAPMIDDKFLDQQTVDGAIEPWEIRIKRNNIISIKRSGGIRSVITFQEHADVDR